MHNSIRQQSRVRGTAAGEARYNHLSESNIALSKEGMRNELRIAILEWCGKVQRQVPIPGSQVTVGSYSPP